MTWNEQQVSSTYRRKFEIHILQKSVEFNWEGGNYVKEEALEVFILWLVREDLWISTVRTFLGDGKPSRTSSQTLCDTNERIVHLLIELTIDSTEHQVQ